MQQAFAKKRKSSKPLSLLDFLAESEGFEPSCDFTRNSISSETRLILYIYVRPCSVAFNHDRKSRKTAVLKGFPFPFLRE